MEILLDTNFILTCIKQKINFNSLANELIDEQIIWVIPEEVFHEINNFKDKRLSKLSLKIIKDLNPKIIKLGGKDPNIDIRISRYLSKRKNIVLATIDKNLKERVSNKILTIRGKKSLDLINR